ncbi:hypothetical protein BDZ91DRAFT_760300 [Kalaharituber pfeilii]|nr:hypothetical protein BDZ91DRAFT_760300 [Kalaharituber pfeilii]
MLTTIPTDGAASEISSHGPDTVFLDTSDESASVESSGSSALTGIIPDTTTEINLLGYTRIDEHELTPVDPSAYFIGKPSVHLMVAQTRNGPVEVLSFNIPTSLPGVTKENIYHFSVIVEPVTRVLSILLSMTSGRPEYTGGTPQTRPAVGTRWLSQFGLQNVNLGSRAHSLQTIGAKVSTIRLKKYRRVESWDRKLSRMRTAGEGFRMYCMRRDEFCGLRRFLRVSSRIEAEINYRPLWESDNYVEIRDKLPSIKSGGSGTQICKKWEFEIPEGWCLESRTWTIKSYQKAIRVYFTKEGAEKLKVHFQPEPDLVEECNEDSMSDLDDYEEPEGVDITADAHTSSMQENEMDLQDSSGLMTPSYPVDDFAGNTS